MAFLALFFLALPISGQIENAGTVAADSTVSKGIFDLLAQNKITEVTITTAFSTFLENKRHTGYLDGKFTFEPSEGVAMTVPVRLRLRGRYRRMKCQFPPLKLKFRKTDLAAHGLNGFNELKLVTHCLDDEETSRELVAREYLAYRLFNILCENSFRAQLVDVTYRNTKGKPKKIKGLGILIEDADEVAHRLHGKLNDTMGIPDSCFNKRQEALVALFQYMIGNTDWSTQLNRNVKLVQVSETDIFPVPYDFDFCGLVDAPYALPKNNIGQLTVRQRVFQGHAKCSADLHDIVHHFMEKKEEILTEVEHFDLLGEDSRKDMTDYLMEFFAAIETEYAVGENLFPKKEKD